MGWGSDIRGSGSGILDPEKPIPDPRVIKELDPGSGFATLIGKRTVCFHIIIRFRHGRRNLFSIQLRK
jgi:hypothetical protein